jgi:hypothetical protein
LGIVAKLIFDPQQVLVSGNWKRELLKESAKAQGSRQEFEL